MIDMIEIKDLTIEFKEQESSHIVVDHISLSIKKGEVVGLVGESGSGKSMTALALAGLLNRHGKITSGQILFEGQDLLRCSQKEFHQYQGDKISMVFQEPMTSLNPVMKIGKQIEEGLKLHKKLSKAERKEQVIDILEQVEIKDPQKVYKQYPHQLSGGMRQRVMIAMALILNPDLLIADEPTTALDVTIQAQIIDLLKKRNETHGTTMLFISHNLGVVKRFCHRVYVMKDGKIVEEGQANSLFEYPKEEYTKRLIDSIPSMTVRRERNRK